LPPKGISQCHPIQKRDERAKKDDEPMAPNTSQLLSGSQME
jgi:hypothetical protein